MEKYFFRIGNSLKPVATWLMAICIVTFIASFVLFANDASVEAGFSSTLIMLWSMVLFGISYFYSGSQSESIAEKQGTMMRKYIGFITTVFFIILVLITVRIFGALLR